jgi:hypothetical protein
VGVKFDGGSADDPLLPKHPLSKGVTIATINIQNNFFTVEFLDGVYSIAVFAVTILNDRTDFLNRTAAFKSVPANLNFETRLKTTLSCSLVTTRTIHDPEKK